ncbi:hypothetical protein QTI27_27310 [Variovorax sp. J31P216]|nr:hypothetical protein [Variovorax sp. J31P216]
MLFDLSVPEPLENRRSDPVRQFARAALSSRLLSPGRRSVVSSFQVPTIWKIGVHGAAVVCAAEVE